MIPVVQIGSIQIPTFFLVISISLSLLLFLLSFRVEKQHKNRKIAFDLALILMTSSFIGGRLMHVFYEEWAYYKTDPLLIIQFWNGGFVFLGGVILSLVTGYMYTLYKKISFFEWADFMTPLFSLGHALGRIGCFMSGCCFGSACVLPWSLMGLHPTALYLAGGEFIIFLMLIISEKKKVYKFAGGLFIQWLLLHSLLRFVVEYFRADFRGGFLNFPILGHLSISQVISLFIIVMTLSFFGLQYSKQTKS